VRLFEQMPVLDNILVVLTERSIWKSLFERHSKLHLEKADEVLKKVGLYEKRNELAKISLTASASSWRSPASWRSSIAASAIST